MMCRDCCCEMVPFCFNGLKRFDLKNTTLVMDRYYPQELISSRYRCRTMGCNRTIKSSSPHYMLSLPEHIREMCPVVLRHRSALTLRLRDEIVRHLNKGRSVTEYCTQINECQEDAFHRKARWVKKDIQFKADANHRKLFADVQHAEFQRNSDYLLYCEFERMKQFRESSSWLIIDHTFCLVVREVVLLTPKTNF